MASAFADALRALLAAASHFGPKHAVHSVLRKHASCDACKGAGCFYDECDERFKTDCRRCSGAGWTLASVEARIAKEEERARNRTAIINAAVNAVLAHSDHDIAVARDALKKAVVDVDSNG